MKLKLAYLPLLAALSCGGNTEVRLSADRDTISAGGTDAATVTADVYLSGSLVGNGTQVSFETTAGSFDASSSLTSTTISTDAKGRAQIKLYSTPTQGTATVTASFSDSTSGLSATSSLTITFGPPSGAGAPVDGTFRMSCNAVNVGALREPLPEIKVTCTLTALTRKGVTIKGSAMNPTFLAEAGSFTIKDDAYSGERVFIYSPKGGASTPKDVTPESTLNEPSYTDNNGRQRNPRDGLVTLVAVLDGEEAFTDTNGNGQYDQGEPFVDSAEPFVDANDNDKCDPDEKYLDLNGNGRWDEANGKWDSNTKIMAIYKILWTGPLSSSSKTSRIDRSSTKISDKGKIELTAYVLDANLNPVAAFSDSSDNLEWTLVSAGEAISNDSTTPPLANALGFSFDKTASSERKRWRLLSNSFTSATYKFTVEDGDPGDTNPQTTFSVTATAHVSAGPDGDGSYLLQATEKIADKVEGTCD
jgi:hypothetical protein